MRTLMGKLAVDGQNVNYCVRLDESVKKPSKIAEFLPVKVLLIATHVGYSIKKLNFDFVMG